MNTNLPSELHTLTPEDAAEMFAVIREANRLATEGGSVDERAAHVERRDALVARIEQREREHALASERLLVDETPTCSYCELRARYMGAGRDGDFYCETHWRRAWNGVVDLSEPTDERRVLETRPGFLREARERVGLDEQTAARRAGVRLNRLRYLELGAVEPTGNELAALTRLYYVETRRS